ncbi:MAG TPA: NRAMP family divalent metal transporter [Acidimicrobiales bacterium]|nr:NRAMP family divalent metal transporter [Acidimicrobiales bacterium]
MRPTTLVRARFGPDADRRSAADRAHRGDIEGALGTVSSLDTGPRHTLSRRFATLAAVMGPGLVVMVADNDAGGITTYAQTGQEYGLRLLCVIVLLAPVLYVNQEMVGRLGAVTGAGHARLIVERFGRSWGAFALGDLLVLNLLTLITELIGVSLSLGYFGVSRVISVPCAAGFLIAATATGSFRRWERAMYLCIVVSLVAIPLLVVSAAAHHSSALTLPIAGEAHASGVLLVVALVGTTVAPWQLFFQQSNVVDKRITARYVAYERVDTAIGTALFVLGALAILLACAFAFAGSALHGTFSDAAGIADGLRARIGPVAGALFAVALLDGSLLGASAVTLASSYAVGDYLGLRHSLHRCWGGAPTFYRTYVIAVLAASAVVLLPDVPLGLLTTAVQALAGILLPSATVFLLLLCNDRAVLGPWVNPRWLNAIALTVVGSLLVLSALLTLTTAFRGLAVAPTATTLAGVLAVVLTVVALRTRRIRTPRADAQAGGAGIWTMPPIESLARPTPSRARSLALVTLRCYLGLAVALLVVKAVQVAVAG